MLIPISTDAPVYHFPLATLGLIAANAAIFAFYGQPDELMLSLGNGWHPTQWVTAAFLHADAFHLIGNMIFLWAYGLVVEGKIGWWRFLGTYLLIGAIQHFIVQTVFGGYQAEAPLRYVLGASGAISGVMAIALLWAPVNSFTVIAAYRWGMSARAWEDEWSVWGFTLWFVGWDLLFAGMHGFSICTAVLHLTGVAVGLVAGFLLLQFRWADCEGFDAFTLWSGVSGRPWSQMQAICQTTHRETVRAAKSSKRKHVRPKVVYLLQDTSTGPIQRKSRKRSD